MSFLMRRYNKPKFKTEIKGFAKITNPTMEGETVPVGQADKYKEFIAGVWENICENDPSMKDVPNEYQTVELQVEPPTPAIGPDGRASRLKCDFLYRLLILLSARRRLARLAETPQSSL